MLKLRFLYMSQQSQPSANTSGPLMVQTSLTLTPAIVISSVYLTIITL